MNEEMGLAAAQGQEQAQPMQDVNQIVQMIMQGMSPEELVEKGVPIELVQAAMEIITKQSTEVPPEQAGLAAQMVRPDTGMM